ncbi:hypothetical protein NPIL_347541 [Nephila pilipes]|uniref:Uncharacterized protein n=1 Tax=Nephila pilipes TaxID=299642 RepID=A0A8X6P3H7_NEPPI|nr:hypothetical protein NPIL_114661 [Nephila pilipes]GFT42300.1 hypothetical protein NPIL_270951 [Nephila pilipes]GFT42707.1 hypothetical protein NPIL_633141 [Nephila pilipes]GFT48888.1 hypothetical protein NPIL_347541 [Nephila pilipes]
MEFKLKKLRIKQLGKAYLDSSVGDKPEKHSTPCHELDMMMLMSDPKNNDISLFSSLFERHEKTIDVDPKDWVSGSLMHFQMPSDIEKRVKFFSRISKHTEIYS